MKQTSMLWIALLVFCSACTSPGKNPQVQVTLSDGQVLVGRLATRTIQLKTGIGTFEIDTAEAGELGLVEGNNMKQADRTVRLWLRNGSEFVGRWEKPAVAVRIPMGGQEVSIDVPIDKLKRLQFRGGAVWPDQPVFRIATTQGDDFFVDVTRTQFKFANEMGRFTPFLSEIERLRPLDTEKKQWRIKLSNGTVFNAALEQEQLELRLAMGPRRIDLPLSAIKTMNRQRLQQVAGRQASSGGFGLFYSNTAQKEAKEEASRRK